MIIYYYLNKFKKNCLKNIFAILLYPTEKVN